VILAGVFKSADELSCNNWSYPCGTVCCTGNSIPIESADFSSETGVEAGGGGVIVGLKICLEASNEGSVNIIIKMLTVKNINVRLRLI
jgi:hypothetical protein